MRLTEICEINGKKYIRIKGTKTLYVAKERDGAPASNAIVRLAAYEDTGFEPEEIDFCLSGVISPQDAKERYEAHKKRYDEWFAWKQAEEQGRLVILPCKVNDTVFVITERGFIAKGEVRNFRFFDKLIVDVEYHHFGTCATSRYWGETVFLTREEAKATLKNSIEKES